MVGRVVPNAPQDEFTPQFDDDGNQTLIKTATGIWQVTYNGENRPILWERDSDNTTLTMSYDHMGRRREKNGQRFFYDGYLQTCNLDSTTTTSNYNYFAWDPTEPVATRLLYWQLRTAEGNYSLFYTHDGNKNISEVVFCQRARGVVAHYEYAPFGAVISQLGSSAAANPWRFSSEYADDKLGCDYYNYREYESMVGRWLGYDFVADCLNRYVWCENYTGGFDFLGLKLKVFGDHEQKEKIIKLLQEIFGGVVQLNGNDVVFQGASDSLGCECKKLICEDPTYSIDFDDKADMYGGGMFKPEPFGGVLGGGISLGSKDSYSRGNELVINRAFPFVHLKEVIEDLDDILAHELAHAILHQQQKPNADQKLFSGDPAKNKLEKEARRLTDYVRKGCHK
jgi:RHS repeat-associated protein